MVTVKKNSRLIPQGDRENPQGYRDTRSNSRLVGAPRPKISNLLRFENGFEIRDLHHFASKNVPHTISQILRVTEIQQFRSNQLLTKNQ